MSTPEVPALPEDLPHRMGVVIRVRAAEPQLPPDSGSGTELRILLAALRLFARHSYPATTVRQIAEAVGIRAPSLYEHFQSKEDILARLVLIGHHNAVSAFHQALADSAPDPASQIRALVRAHVLAHAGYPLLALVSNDELHHLSPARTAAPLAMRAEVVALFVRCVGRGVEEGVFAPVNPTATIAVLSGMGLRLPHWYEPTPELGLNDLADAYADLAIRMLTGPGDR